MPFIPAQTEASAPKGGHFALLASESGARLAIRPGASLWLVEDPSQADKIFPLTLKRVSVKSIVFQMTQADGSTTEYVYKLQSAKPLGRASLKRLLTNRGDAPTKVQR
jgi:hypothetical protein